MSNNRAVLALVAGLVALCLCLACGGFGLAAYFALPTSVTARPTEGTFRGMYTGGFEVSSFVPCSDSNIDGAGGAWWLGSTPESGFYDRYRDTIGPNATEYVTVYVEWQGTVSPPGQYGHLGAYTREATVKEVLEMSLDGTC